MYTESMHAVKVSKMSKGPPLDEFQSTKQDVLALMPWINNKDR